ncbi:MAG: outer membrane beta-barrel protein, partial [Myxococcota bacterium]|nr:outer membrane beta-barrel protein [Myxococcota bacterium]
MLRQALGFWLVSLLMFVPIAHAQDDEFEESEESDGESEIVELVGVDNFARESWYMQVAFSHASDRKLQDKLNQNADRAVSPPPELFIPDPNYARPGQPYGAPGLLISIGPVDVASSNGADVRFGRRLNSNLSVETQFEYQKFDTKIDNWGPVTVDTYGVTVNLKIALLTGRIQPYGLLGGGFMYAKPDAPFPIQNILASRNSSDITKYEEIVDARNFGALMRLGGGVDVYLNENIYMMAETTFVSSQGEDVDDIKYLAFTL